MKTLKFTEQGNKTILKENNKIVGYTAPAKNGFSYNIGKPSDITVASFTKNDAPGFTLLEAKSRLMQLFINK